MELVIYSIVCIVYVHVFRFICDGLNTKRQRKVLDLGQDAGWKMQVQNHGWNASMKARAVGVVNDYKLDLIKSDSGLRE